MPLPFPPFRGDLDDRAAEEDAGAAAEEEDAKLRSFGFRDLNNNGSTIYMPTTANGTIKMKRKKKNCFMSLCCN